MASLFYYLKLNRQARSLYPSVRRQLIAHGGGCIPLPLMGGSEATGLADALSATQAVIADNPEVLVTMGTIMARQLGGTVTVEVPAAFAATELPGLNQRMEHTVRELCSGIPHDMPPYERELAVYKRLTTHVRYRNSGGREDHTAAGPLVFGQGVCEGIAKAYALLLRRMGVSSIYVQGRAGTDGGEPHAWNMVLLNGQTYHCDATFDIADSYMGYFNLTDEDIRRDHTLPAGLPPCNALTDNYHARNRTRFTDPAALRRFILSALWKGSPSVAFYIGKGMPGSGLDCQTMIHRAMMFAPPSFQGYKLSSNDIMSAFRIFK